MFKQLTNRRPTEAATYNDVIRELLKPPKLDKSAKLGAGWSKPWIVSDTSFPAGSEFMADYKGKTYSGIAKGGKLELSDDRKFTTLAAAAIRITGSKVNGWRFWKCRLPGARQFAPIERLCRKAH